MPMTSEEKQIWYATYGATFARRNRAFGAGQAYHDLVVAAEDAMQEADDAVSVLRKRLDQATEMERNNAGPVRTALEMMQQAPPDEVTTQTLPVYGIEVTTTATGGGALKSDLGEGYEQLESLLLAMACAGINLNTPAMFEAIETAVEAISNHEE